MLDEKGRYTVIRDTREKAGQGWSFSHSTRCTGTKEQKLNTGDYSLLGYEDLFTIERKGSVNEFAGNITQKRFQNEIERLMEFKYRFIIIEASFGKIINYPHGCGLSPHVIRKIRVSGNFILSKITEYEIKYGISIIVADQYGKEIASQIFKRIVDNA